MKKILILTIAIFTASCSCKCECIQGRKTQICETAVDIGTLCAPEPCYGRDE